MRVRPILPGHRKIAIAQPIDFVDDEPFDTKTRLKKLDKLAKASSDNSSRETQNVYGAMKRGNGREGEASANRRYTDEGGTNFAALPGQRRNDSGSAARFFKQIEWEDDEWLAQNLQLSFANIAEEASSLQSVLDAFAQSGAATSVLPEGSQLSASTTPSTNATASELKALCEAATTAIRFIAPRFSREWPQTKLTLSDNPVSVVAVCEQTGTMTITVDRWKSDGCAAPVTFTITLTQTTEVGGQASRLKYCAKASKSDRDDGLDDFAALPSASSEFRPNHAEKAAEGADGSPYGRWKPLKNNHPTVKPTDLMRYLCRLVTPPGGKVLDPFAGSGSTGRGAVLEGFQFTGIEMAEEYVEIARARIAAARKRYEDEVYV